MRIRSDRPIGLPKSSAGHFDHFDVIGLEAFVDRSNVSHARWGDEKAVGASPRANK
jgi:hypothetical protein